MAPGSVGEDKIAAVARIMVVLSDISRLASYNYVAIQRKHFSLLFFSQ
jgi:hypothetical protein